jgi:hypothetical protein
MIDLRCGLEALDLIALINSVAVSFKNIDQRSARDVLDII